jgi:hypothetical protein
MKRPLGPEDFTDAVLSVLDERSRQQKTQGFDAKHDDAREIKGELVDAAMCYMAGHKLGIWPWPDFEFSCSSRRRGLIKAAALLLAEIEQLDRRSALECKNQSGIGSL